MLKNSSVFISYCNTHCAFSFRLQSQQGIAAAVISGVLPASFVTAERSRAIAKAVIPTGNHQPFPADKTVCDLVSCLFIKFRYCCAGDIHLLCTLLMSAVFQIDEADRFVFFQRQRYGFRAGYPGGRKSIKIRFSADASASFRSCHEYLLST